MNIKNVHYVHSLEYDPKLGDAFINNGLFKMLINNDIDKVTLIAAGQKPKQSHLAAKTQAFQFSNTYTPIFRCSPLVCDIESIVHLPANWSPKVSFFSLFKNKCSTSMDCSCKLPPYLHEPSLCAQTIPDIKLEYLLQEITEGTLIYCQALEYIDYIKYLNKSGVDFGKSILVLKNTYIDDPLSIYSNDFIKIITKFSKVYIDNAYNLYSFDKLELSTLITSLVNQNYRNNSTEYIKSISCGTRLIHIIEHYPFIASRQCYAFNKKFWEKYGPYEHIFEKLMCIWNTLSKYKSIQEKNFNKFKQEILLEIKNEEKNHSTTHKGIKKLYDCLLFNSTPADEPIVMRMLLMLFLSQGYPLRIGPRDNVVEYLKEHPKRSINGLSNIILIHKILETNKSKKYQLAYHSYDNISIIDKYPDDSEAFRIICDLLCI